MEEDIKESINKFEEYLENVKSDDVHKNSMYNDNYGYVTMQFTPFSNKDIENLIARYKEVEDKIKTLETLLQGNLYEMYLYYKELAGKYQANSISKDKVKEKIEELSKLEKGFNFTGLITECETKIEVLQELLEES